MMTPLPLVSKSYCYLSINGKYLISLNKPSILTSNALLLNLLHIDAKFALVLGSKADHTKPKAPSFWLAELDHGYGSSLSCVLNDLLEGLVIEVLGLGVSSVCHQGACGGCVRCSLRFMFSFSLTLASLFSRLGLVTILIRFNLISTRREVEDQLATRSDVKVLWQDGRVQMDLKCNT